MLVMMKKKDVFGYSHNEREEEENTQKKRAGVLNCSEQERREGQTSMSYTQNERTIQNENDLEVQNKKIENFLSTNVQVRTSHEMAKIARNQRHFYAHQSG